MFQSGQSLFTHQETHPVCEKTDLLDDGTTNKLQQRFFKNFELVGDILRQPCYIYDGTRFI